MKAIWSRRALRDVEYIRDYITQDSPAYAQPFIERLLHTTRHLPRFPHSGRPMPEAGNPSIREVIYQGYRIIYRLCLRRLQDDRPAPDLPGHAGRRAGRTGVRGESLNNG